MAHWQSEPRYVEPALLLGLPCGEHLSVSLLDVTRVNVFFRAAVHERHVCPLFEPFALGLTADIYPAGCSFPCGLCMTRTRTSRVLCAPRRSVWCARWNDALGATPYGPCVDISTIPCFISQRNICMLRSYWPGIYHTSMIAPENKHRT
jgi:hypothetical protein